MNSQDSKVVQLRAYSIKELALIYEIDRRTFMKWLKPHEQIVGKQNGHYYNIPQVKLIFERLSIPKQGVLEF
jgi:hypothetical protein